MNKFYKYIFVFISLIKCGNTVEDLSFLSIPGSAFSNSLGNSITSTINSPSALLLSPANIWDDSKYSFMITNRNHNISGVKYVNAFVSWRPSIFRILIDKSSFGIVSYGVNKIEEYNNDAVFENYFNFNNNAIFFGISKRTLGVDVGLGVNYVNKQFSINNFNKNYFGFDLGFTMHNLISNITKNSNNMDLVICFVMKEIFPISNNESAITTVSLGSSFLINLNQFSFKVHSDFNKYNYSPFIRNRSGFESKYTIKNLVSLTANFGYNGIVSSLNEVDLVDLVDYDRKITYGLFIDIFSNKLFLKSSKNIIFNFGLSGDIVSPVNEVKTTFITFKVEWFNN